MKNVLHNKGCNSGTNPAHVEPPPIPVIKETYNSKSDEDLIRLKLHRDNMSSTSDLYEFSISLFEHGKTEEFLLFIRNCNMNLATTGTLETDAEIQYLCMLFCGQALRHFDLLSDDA